MFGHTILKDNGATYRVIEITFFTKKFDLANFWICCRARSALSTDTKILGLGPYLVPPRAQKKG